MIDTTTEKDPSLRHASPEDSGWSNGVYTKNDLNAMYGLESTPSEGDGTIAVEDLGPRVDMRRVATGVDGDPYLDALGDQRIDEAGLNRDAQEVQSGANQVLGEMGMNGPDSSVDQQEAMTSTAAEVLTNGQGYESGRLNNEDLRDARDAAIAVELDKALRRGDTEPLEHLPPSVAVKVTNWLGEVGRTYGAAEFAPVDETAAIGRYIAFAEKVSDQSQGETTVRIDETTGEATEESTDDIIMRVIDGDPEATALLDPESQARTQALKDDLLRQTGDLYSSHADAGNQQELVDYIRRALLVSNATRLAA